MSPTEHLIQAARQVDAAFINGGSCAIFEAVEELRDALSRLPREAPVVDLRQARAQADLRDFLQRLEAP